MDYLQHISIEFAIWFEFHLSSMRISIPSRCSNGEFEHYFEHFEGFEQGMKFGHGMTEPNRRS